MFPKSWHCQKGGSHLCQDFFGGFVHNALRALQSDHSSPKSDNLPPKVPLFPRIDHLTTFFNIFTHKNYLLLSKNVASCIYVLLLAKFSKVPGLGGGGVNPILAMPGSWDHMVLQPLP